MWIRKISQWVDSSLFVVSPGSITCLGALGCYKKKDISLVKSYFKSLQLDPRLLRLINCETSTLKIKAFAILAFWKAMNFNNYNGF
jgi:hypothetical protein